MINNNKKNKTIKKTDNKKVIVGLSGGIDSSISLFLLKKQGFDLIGASLKLPLWKGKKSFLNAEKICNKLNVPYYLLDVKKDFEKNVVDYFINELKRYNTPNPCVICNRYLKFSSLLDFAKKQKADYIATGHYARIKKNKKNKPLKIEYQLLKAKDKTKDQTYNLCFLTQKQLKKIIFPLENYTKKQVYNIAKKNNFSFLLKQKQSQDFCYLAGHSVSDYLKNTLNKKPGNIVNTKGKIIGKHQGLHFYTIGQRKGLKISGGPFYVKGLNTKNNQVVVTKNKKDIFKKEIYLSPFNFISGIPLKRKTTVSAKIRYQQKQGQAVLYSLKGNKIKIVFIKPQLAVTPGQFVVFYRKEVCLGGGRILG